MERTGFEGNRDCATIFQSIRSYVELLYKVWNVALESGLPSETSKIETFALNISMSKSRRELSEYLERRQAATGASAFRHGMANGSSSEVTDLPIESPKVAGGL